MICPMERNFRVVCYKTECMRDGMCVKSEEPPTRERKEPMEQENRLIELVEDIAVSMRKIAALQERRIALLEDCNTMQADDLKMRYEVNTAIIGAAKRAQEEGGKEE